jgi:hypothetical protein
MPICWPFFVADAAHLVAFQCTAERAPAGSYGRSAQATQLTERRESYRFLSLGQTSQPHAVLSLLLHNTPPYSHSILSEHRNRLNFRRNFFC